METEGEVSAVGVKDQAISSLSHQVTVTRNELNNIRSRLQHLKKFAENEFQKILNLLTGEHCKMKQDTHEADAAPGWQMQSIGMIESVFREKNGTPRQSVVCANSTARLVLNKEAFTNPAHSLEGLSEFSHVWLLFVFHKNQSFSRAKVTPPRLDGHKLGVFSTRSPHRPNPIGLSLAKLEHVEGCCLHLSSIDLMDGTPILDIKPYIPHYDDPQSWPELNLQARRMEPGNSEIKFVASDIRIPRWISEPPVKRLQVVFTDRALRQLQEACEKNQQESCTPEGMMQCLQDILAEDPRSVYRRNKCRDKLYYFSFRFVHCTCWFDDESAVEVVKIQEKSNKT